MAVARASATLGRTVLRRASAQTRSQAWRQLGRRGYASAEHAKKSSDLPWMIGSVVLTVPAAVWLMGQAPKKSDHHASHHEEKEAPEEDSAQESQEEDKSEDDSEEKQSSTKDESTQTDESSEDKEDDKEDKKDDSKDESKDESKDDNKDKESKEDGSSPKTDKDGYELPGPNAPGQINWSSSKSNGKGPGEGQKAGERKATEKKGEKDAASDFSGAKNPYLDDDEKSKKGEGLKDTMKIHGTVDSNRPLSGDGGSSPPNNKD